jgi:hypothetical protein
VDSTFEEEEKKKKERKKKQGDYKKVKTSDNIYVYLC